MQLLFLCVSVPLCEISPLLHGRGLPAENATCGSVTHYSIAQLFGNRLGKYGDDGGEQDG